MVYKTFDEIIAKLQGHAKKSRMAVEEVIMPGGNS